MNTIKQISKLSFGLTKFLVVERIISTLTRMIDMLIIGLILAFPSPASLIWIFAATTILNLFFCISVVCSIEYIRIRYNFDATGLEELKCYVAQNDTFVKRILSKVLSSRRSIFWIGSWFYLDPDYVTLLLRRKERRLRVDLVEVTLPSVLLAMIVWVPVYWICVHAAKLGYGWATYLISS